MSRAVRAPQAGQGACRRCAEAARAVLTMEDLTTAGLFSGKDGRPRRAPSVKPQSTCSCLQGYKPAMYTRRAQISRIQLCNIKQGYSDTHLPRVHAKSRGCAAHLDCLQQAAQNTQRRLNGSKPTPRHRRAAGSGGRRLRHPAARGRVPRLAHRRPPEGCQQCSLGLRTRLAATVLFLFGIVYLLAWCFW